MGGGSRIRLKLYTEDIGDSWLWDHVDETEGITLSQFHKLRHKYGKHTLKSSYSTKDGNNWYKSLEGSNEKRKTRGANRKTEVLSVRKDGNKVRRLRLH